MNDAQAAQLTEAIERQTAVLGTAMERQAVALEAIARLLTIATHRGALTPNEPQR